MALNVALYGATRRWALTERGRSALARDRRQLVIGPSSCSWDGELLSIRIVERGALLGERIEGEVRVWPEALVGEGFALDGAGLHRWQPIAARARVEARFDRPRLAWSGAAYVDSNFGAAPLEHSFDEWQWSRAHLPGGTAVFYEGTLLDGGAFDLALMIGRDGRVAPIADPPPLARLPRTRWRMPRSVRCDPAARPRVVNGWEDAPFYSRSALQTVLWGTPALAVHESLSMPRFIHPATQWMIPWRMPRRP